MRHLQFIKYNDLLVVKYYIFCHHTVGAKRMPRVTFGAVTVTVTVTVTITILMVVAGI